ncbi:BglG family transcription antiterminator [Megamonas hypermegale]|uniref:BglG family transcription antiterminator n=1 Tax=Megamonas hypermegale TaxID=158847 RepID=UPI0026EBAC7F|nr:BglG family transcription antiterminator [Megamonas hypermegale]
MKINERSKFIINKLIQTENYITASEIAEKLKVSNKTVVRQLGSVEKILVQHNLSLERKTGRGMRVIGAPEDKERLLSLIAEKVNTRHEYSPAERCNIILSQLLKSQEPIKLIALSQLLNVTDATISNDLDKIEPWIRKMNMNLVRKPGLGVYLEGLEKDIRKAIISHIYENIHEQDILNLLYSKKKKTNELTSDADKFLLDLVDKNIIQKVEEAVKATMQQQKSSLSMNAFSGLVVHLTLAVQRLLKGETIKIDAAFLGKIKQKKEFELAENIGENIEKVFQVKIPEEETAYITMHLLGARNNYEQDVDIQYSSFHLIRIAKDIVKIAQQESGISLLKKSRLLIGLYKHLKPAVMRIKMKMEIRNPLLQEMKEKYPKWMTLAKKAARPLEEELQTPLPEAEIAYLAMHLGAALEEANMQEQYFKILVACPTGIGTSKLLATQLKREFSNLEIVAIVSAVNVDYDFYKHENVEFIISTVPIENAKFPVVVVDFMLNENDKTNIIHQMNISTVLKKNVERVKVNYKLIYRLERIDRYIKYIHEVLTNFFYDEYIEIKDIDELCAKTSHVISGELERELLYHDLKNRESKGSTVLNKLMILHTKSKAVQSLHVGVIKLQNEYVLNKENISTILVLLAPDNAEQAALETIGYVSESLLESLNLLDILYEGSSKEIYGELEKIYTNYFKEKYKKVMEG